ncbi:MAG: lipid-A-disaccharide synthase [Robiginitomaculum sp.]
MKPAPLLYIIAAERSGDQLGAQLIAHIKARDGAIKLSGIGGGSMAEQGIKSPFDIAPLSILGLFEGLKSYPTIMKLVKHAVADVMEHQPDMVVLIDSWGFMMRVAERLKKAGYGGTIVKYVAPQVWAMREGRTKVLARSVDHLLTIHSFDAPYFEREGLPVTYIGNPIFDTDYKAGNGAALRARYNIDKDAPILAVMFGSRRSEIERLSGPFADAIEILKKDIPNLVCVSALADNVATQIRAKAGEDLRLQDIILLEERDKLAVFDMASAALACSGTLTTQLACAGVPTVIGYRLSAATWAVAGRLYKPDYVAIVNIAAKTELMPERIQNQCTGEKLAAALTPYLNNSELREAASKKLIKATDAMRGGDRKASARAADALIEILNGAA